jgi:glycosyltransferase involved in cell wall biosynthesis
LTRFLLITATDLSDRSRAALAELAESIDRQDVAGDHVLVLRGDGPLALPQDGGVERHMVSVGADTSLSRARNQALAYAREHGLLERNDLVAFPDDDARFGDGALARVTELLADDDAFVCVPYAPTPAKVNRERFPAGELRVSPALVMRSVSSNTMFLATDAVGSVGDFDERYGLGARFGSSEDADYALRVLSAGYTGSYHGGHVLVEHEYKTHRPAEYYLGNVAALAKHARRGGTRFFLIRRLIYGAATTVARRMTPRAYGRALRAAVELLRSGPAEDGAASSGRSAPSPRPSAPGW